MDFNNQGVSAITNAEKVANVFIFIATLLMVLPVMIESLKEKQILMEANTKAKNK